MTAVLCADQVLRPHRRTTRALLSILLEKRNIYRLEGSFRNVASTAEYELFLILNIFFIQLNITQIVMKMLCSFSFFSVWFSGPEPLPQVSQHRRQPGCGDGYRDCELVKENDGANTILLSLMIKCVGVCVCYRWARPKTALWPINW